MKALISGIKYMEIHDGDGIRTTVFFKGCPLKCIWCHNPESISYEPELARFDQKCIACGACSRADLSDTPIERAEHCPTEALVLYGKEYGVDDLLAILLRDAPFFAASGGGVTLSGGECLSHRAFVTELARRLYNEGISVNIDTSGYVPWQVLEEIFPFVDTFLYDIKAFDPAVHSALTGKDNALILDNLRRLSSIGAKIEIRIPLVVGCNEHQIEPIADYLADVKGIVRVRALRYHDFAASRYKALGKACTLPPPLTTDADVIRAIATLRTRGLNATDAHG